MTIHEDLARIQKELRAPKSQYNKFRKYNYRNCEDILMGLKECLNGCTVTLEDDVIMVGDRIYIKATATLHNGTESISTTSMARESESKKGMDDSMVTGTASSYARKYALNGLFAIDDNKDADMIESVEEKLESIDTVKGLTEFFKTLAPEQQGKVTKKFASRKKEIQQEEKENNND